MITEIFKTIVLLSLAGSITILLIMLLKPFTERVFGAVWQYYIWLAAILVMLCPFRIDVPVSVPQQTTVKIYEIAATIGKSQVSNVILAPVKNTNQVSIDLSDALAFLWFATATVLMLYRAICYLAFKRSVRKNSVYETRIGRIAVYRSSLFASPLLAGVFKPVLILPDTLANPENLEYVLKHELLHHKRCDIAYKWLIVFIKCIHWFNPLVYVLAREVDSECEVSCDAMLTKRMNTDEKKAYMNTVLSLIERRTGNRFIPFTSLANNKRILKKRFKTITRSTASRPCTRIISIISAIILCISSAFVSAFALTVPVLPKELTSKTVNPSTAAESTVKSLVVEENSNETQVLTSIHNEISQPVPSAEIPPQSALEPPNPQIKKNDTSDEVYVNVETIPFSDKMDADTVVSLIRSTGDSYIKGEFNYDGGPRKVITDVAPDKNGNITLYLNSEVGEIIQIELSETSSQQEVWGVRVPAEGDRSYSFTGLDTEKKYNIYFYSPAKESWEIDSEYIIY